MGNAYKILVGKGEGKRQLGKPRRRCETILEWILEKCDGKLWTECIWLRLRTSSGLV
jgi:hypothetical protein